jgi:SPP1 gp7 family putative phage head morphogenesis protein
LKQIKRKRVVLPDFRPNAGIRASYRAELNSLLRSARNEVMAAVAGHWQPAPAIAMDAARDVLGRVIDTIIAKWMTSLNDLPQKMARRFVGQTAGALDRGLSATLKKSGFAVNLQLTDATKEAMRVSVGMNVGLIKSIPGEYLGDVQKYVWESVEAGFDLKTLTDNLEHAYHVGRNRAKLIARDQSNKVHAVMEQARRKELGITKAIWRHSAAAREPRKSHVAANGKEFDIEKGMYLDGEWVLPGQPINCGCTSSSVLEW